MRAVILSNGKSYDTLCVNATTRFIQEANRDCLEIQLSKEDYSLAQIEADFTSGNTAKLKLTDGSTQYIHDNFGIRAELALRPVEITTQTTDAPPVYEERICVVLARFTNAEVQLKELRDTVDVLLLTSLEGGAANV